MNPKYQKEKNEMNHNYRDWPNIEGLKVPTPKEASENRYLYRYNEELCEEKGLTDGNGLTFHYLYMQAVYRANLDAYLLEVLGLRDLDQELKDSGLGFIRRRPANQNLYEKESTMDLEFICMRNNLYIEYLGEEQLNLIGHQLEELQSDMGTTMVTDELKAMAEETYQEVIRVRNSADLKGKERFLYPKEQGCKPEIPNQALVLEISNAMEYDASGNLLHGDRMKERWEYLDRLKEEKEREYSEILGTEVFILLE